MNSCLCYLKLGQFSKCIEQATKVLREDPSNMKALFRRGDAHLSVGRFKEAVKVSMPQLEAGEAAPSCCAPSPVTHALCCARAGP
jgi:hypothetical protein